MLNKFFDKFKSKKDDEETKKYRRRFTTRRIRN